MRIYTDIGEARRTVLLRKPFDAVEVSPRVQEGLDRVFGKGTTPVQAVERILADVRREGDAAVGRFVSERVERRENLALRCRRQWRTNGRSGFPDEERKPVGCGIGCGASG